MSDDQIVYQRNVSDPRSWGDFSVEHVAFGLHRVTGWLLLGWTLVHLGLPALSSPEAVWAPTSTTSIVFVMTILLFHGFNGIRLLLAELTGVGAGNPKRLFGATVALCAALVVGLGGML
jgi:succinate dehydrogenase/fumarate reductase cytochrome b subunit